MKITVVVGWPQAKYLETHWLNPEFGKKLANVAGSSVSELAKIIGMTPAMFTRSGIWVFCPPYILRPTTRLAY